MPAIFKSATPQIYDLGHRSQAMLERLAKLDIVFSEQELQNKKLSKQILLAQIYDDLKLTKKIVEFKQSPQTTDLAVLEEFNREKNFLDMQIANKIYRIIVAQLIQDSLDLFTQAEQLKKQDLLVQQLKNMARSERFVRDQSYAIIEVEKTKLAQLLQLQAQASQRMQLFHHEIKNLNKKVSEVRAQKQLSLDFHINKMAYALQDYTINGHSKPFANTTLAQRRDFARQYLQQNHKLKRKLRKHNTQIAALQKHKKELENQKCQLIKMKLAAPDIEANWHLTSSSSKGEHKTLPYIQQRRAGPLTSAFRTQRNTDSMLYEDRDLQAIQEKLATIHGKLKKITDKREVTRDKLANLALDVATTCKITGLIQASTEEQHQFKHDHAELRKKMHRERAILADLKKEHKEEIKTIQSTAHKIVAACQATGTELSPSLAHLYAKVSGLSPTDLLSKQNQQNNS